MPLFGCCSATDVPDETDDWPSDRRKSRRCTDLLCLSLFALFWLILIFISLMAFMIGNPLRLIHGSDSFGNTCGHKNEYMADIEFSGLDLTDKPYLYHLDASNPRESLKICVKQCPDREMTNMNDIYNFFIETNSSLCRYDYDFIARPNRYFTAASTDNNDKQQMCPKNKTVYPSQPVLYRCVPELAVKQGYIFGHSVYDYISSYLPLKKVINDLVNSYKEIVIMILLATSVAFVSAFVIHFIAGIASMIILITVAVSLIALTAFMWYAYYDAKTNLNKISLDQHLPIFYDDQDNEQIVLFLSIGVSILAIILLMITWALRTRVKFVVALFKEAASCIRAMPLLLIQPIWTLLILTLFFMVWLFVLLALATADYAIKEQRELEAKYYDNRQTTSTDGNKLASFTLIDYNDPSSIQYMWWYLIVAFIWTSEFILSCQQLVIAGAVSSWYFTRDRANLSCAIGGSIRRVVCYHMGSAALGSFFITLLKVPRLVITYMEKKLKNYNNCVTNTCLKCCTCCLWCIEKCVRYLNRNAYIVIAIEGSDFCPSAATAFNCIVSNALRVAAINSVGDFILFLGKISVTAITALVGAMLMKNNPMLHYWTLPVILVSVFAFWIAHCILSVYEMVIDTLFLCFCQDYNKNDGSPGKEYYAPPSLIEFLTGEDVDSALKPLRSKRADDPY